MHFIAYIFLRLCNLMEVYTSMLKHSVIFFVLRINLQISTSQRNMMGSIFRVNLIRPYHVQCTLLRQRNIIFPANMMTSYLPDFDNDHSNFVYKKSGLIYLYLVLSAQACQSSFGEFIIFYRIKKSTET